MYTVTQLNTRLFHDINPTPEHLLKKDYEVIADHHLVGCVNTLIRKHTSCYYCLGLTLC